MSVAKREISLTETLGLYLSYTPNYAETDQFRADLRTLNHTLLYDSIRDCQEAARAPEHLSGAEKRKLIHAVYTRKVKELAALYPCLFAVENALRGLAAERLAAVFGDAFWWRIFVDAAQKGKTSGDFTLGADGKKRVKGVPVNPAFVEAALFGVNSMKATQRKELSLTDCLAGRFFEALTLGALTGMMKADWSLFGVALRKSDFVSYAGTLCEARNELFHGNPIKNRSTLVSACERILDSLGFHLSTFDIALGATKYTRFLPSIDRGPRHLVPPE